MEIHGEWELKVVRDVVVSILRDSWNEEAIAAYFAEYKPVTKGLGRYCTLARYDGWTGYTPEAAAIADRLRRWAYEHGCVCGAWVLEDPSMKRWIDLFRRQDDGMHEVRTFSTVAEAIEWLATQGFAIDEAEVEGTESEHSTADADLGNDDSSTRRRRL